MNINRWLANHGRNCQYGAPLGASNWRGEQTGVYKFYVQEIRLDTGGYAPDGIYWGGGKFTQPLFAAWDPEGVDQRGEEGVRQFVRAKNRADAIRQIAEMYPKSCFYRR